jgi:hypothetical protein
MVYPKQTEASILLYKSLIRYCLTCNLAPVDQNVSLEVIHKCSNDNPLPVLTLEDCTVVLPALEPQEYILREDCEREEVLRGLALHIERLLQNGQTGVDQERTAMSRSKHLRDSRLLAFHSRLSMQEEKVAAWQPFKAQRLLSDCWINNYKSSFPSL